MTSVFQKLLFKQVPEEQPAAPAPTSSQHEAVDTEVYQRLVARTRFEVTAVGEKVAKYLKALEGDPDSKLKTALGLVQKIEGLSKTQILESLDRLRDVLKNAKQTEQELSAKTAQTEIQSRQNHLNELDQEIKEIEERLTKLKPERAKVSAELEIAVDQAAAASASLENAVSRRQKELEDEAKSIAALL